MRRYDLGQEGLKVNAVWGRGEKICYKIPIPMTEVKARVPEDIHKRIRTKALVAEEIPGMRETGARNGEEITKTTKPEAQIVDVQIVASNHMTKKDHVRLIIRNAEDAKGSDTTG